MANIVFIVQASRVLIAIPMLGYIVLKEFQISRFSGIWFFFCQAHLATLGLFA